MKSTWAFNNGKKIMKEALLSGKETKDFDFIEMRGALKYAENKRGELVVKTYANKTQASKKCDELNLLGINCFISFSHPFTIIKED